jgi:hypothetical protein
VLPSVLPAKADGSFDATYRQRVKALCERHFCVIFKKKCGKLRSIELNDSVYMNTKFSLQRPVEALKPIDRLFV